MHFCLFTTIVEVLYSKKRKKKFCQVRFILRRTVGNAELRPPSLIIVPEDRYGELFSLDRIAGGRRIRSILSGAYNHHSEHRSTNDMHSNVYSKKMEEPVI
jgi:hypothetical protein